MFTYSEEHEMFRKSLQKMLEKETYLFYKTGKEVLIAKRTATECLQLHGG